MNTNVAPDRSPQGLDGQPVADAAESTAASACATVYFDGACPLCSREIAFYRRLKGAEALRWVDIEQASPAELGPDLSRDQALARFHVRDASGQLVSGGAGFVRIWEQVPALRWLAWLAARPPLSWLLEPAYRAFLRFRPWLVRRQRAA